MATQLAHAHGHLSNRARVRAALDRKPVFKSVLENPFQISWPSVPANVQNVLLARLMATLENIPCRAHGKIPQQMGISGRQENVDITEENSQALDKVSGASPHFAVGINVVTRALESQLCFTRKHVITDVPSQNRGQLPPPSALSPIETVFVCYADVDPPALVAHIPYLVAGCNSPRNATQPIKLVPLPKGSEQAISQLLGVRRAAVVAFRRGSPLSEAVRDVLDAVPIVSAPWLCPSDVQATSRLVPTHIKQLRTTAPRDMKSAREQRSKARAAAKKNASSSSRRKHRITLTTGPESSA